MADSVLERTTCAVGTNIFKEGDMGDRAYVIQQGLVEIVKSTDDGDIVLGTVGKGAIFGEMALIDDGPRMATARAAKACTLIVITRPAFEVKMARTDPFIRGLLKILVENVRSVSGGDAKDEPDDEEADEDEEEEDDEDDEEEDDAEEEKKEGD